MSISVTWFAIAAAALAIASPALSATSAPLQSRALAERLSATINLAPKGAEAGLLEAELLTVVQRSGLGCREVRDAMRTVSSSAIPKPAAVALSSLWQAAAACSASAALTAGDGPTAAAAAPTISGGGGSNYVK